MAINTTKIPSDYKQTKIGIIPKDWEVMKLREICKLKSGGTPLRKKETYWNGSIPWVTTTLVNFNTILDTEEFITEEGLKNSSANIFPQGTTIMAIYGQGITRGKVAQLGIDASTNQACVAFLKGDLDFQRFLFYVLSYQYSKLRNLSNDGSQKNLSSALLSNYTIPLPPITEQKAIAACLSTWDKAIDKTQKLIDQLKQRNKGLMQQLLTGKIRLKNENGEKFCGEWKMYSYRQLLKVIQRPVKWDDDELYQLISVRRRSGGIFNRDSLFGHQIKVKNLRATEEGDFLFSKMQIVHGASALVTQEYSGAKISGSYIATIAKDPNKLNMRFFNWYSKLPYFYYQTYISSYGVHIEKMTFNFRSFLKLKMNVPPIEEQTTIANLLDKATQEVQLQEEKLAALKEQKKGLMQVLLTGKKRLKILN